MTKNARANVVPIHLLAQRPGDRQQTLIAERMLSQGHELRHQHVLKRHHAHLHAEHGHYLSASDQGVIGGNPLGREDQIDQRVAVPGLDQPFLRRRLVAQPGLLQRRDGVVGVLGADHEVEVVAGLRAASRPAREAACEQERDFGRAQRGGGLLQRVLEVGEWLLVIRGHGEWLPGPVERVCGNE
jgi:hypothetical protein